jgi:hypothetical protein
MVYDSFIIDVKILYYKIDKLLDKLPDNLRRVWYNILYVVIHIFYTGIK